MALLQLKNLSKIYTSQNNVSVGISNVNLSLNKDEIVAITGKSGAGKSTLLKVLGGLESYESGEMYFNGKSTSHYNNEEWERYLDENISFIFQEYNILESFTVLENVMFALTKIKNHKQRKQIAIQIINKVGLKDKLNQKGAKLSGGEKQRTVIARAIAKDAPIILADEPTGNLDSKTAKDVLNLLKDCAKGKLLVIVTHNYNDVKDFATKHVCVFDGKVSVENQKDEVNEETIKDDYDFSDERSYIFKTKQTKPKVKNSFNSEVKDIIGLGVKRYSSRPKQSVFMTTLFLVMGILLFVVNIGFASLNSVEFDNKYKGAVYQDNRVVVIKDDGTDFSRLEAENLQSRFNANNFVLNDNVLDYEFTIREQNNYNTMNYSPIKVGTNLNFDVDKGRQIQNEGEIVLRLPYVFSNKYKLNDTILIKDNKLDISGLNFKIVGIKYFIGERGIVGEISNKDAQIYAMQLEKNISVLAKNSDKTSKLFVMIDDSLKNDDAYIYQYDEKANYLSSSFMVNNTSLTPIGFSKLKVNKKTVNRQNNDILFVGRDFYYKNFINTNNLNSNQISLYFNNTIDAKNCSKQLNNKGFKAIYSKDFKNNEKNNQIISSFSTILLSVGMGIILAFCLIKIINSNKEEVYIYRTMGIDDKIIKGSSFVHMILNVLPIEILIVALYLILYMTPIGASFMFMQPLTLIFICVSLLIMSIVVALCYNKLIYKQKINKGLRRTNK